MTYFFSYMWPFIRRHATKWVLVGSIGGLLMNILAAFVPVTLGKALDSALAIEAAPDDPLLRSHLISNLVIFTLVSAFYSFFRVGKRMGFRFTENRMKRYLREAAHSITIRWPMERLKSFRVGDLMSRMVGDVDVMSNSVRGPLTELFDTVVMMTVSFCVLLYYDFTLTLLVAIPAPFVVLIAEAAGRVVQKRMLSARTATGSVVAQIEEAISGIRVLRLLGCEEEQALRLESLTRTEVDRNLSVLRIQAGILPACSALAHVGTAAVIFIGGGAVIRGEMSVGDFVAYLILFEKAVRRTLVIAREVNTIHAGRAALIRTEPLLSNGNGIPAADTAAGRADGLHIRDLTFTYSDNTEPVLHGIDLDVSPGQIVGITGSVGSGKSALARALLGIYPWVDGRVHRPDDSNYGGDARSLLGLVAYCPQDAFLFSGTVAENIAFSDASKVEASERLSQAAYIVALEEDIAGFPDGFDTSVGEGGVRVSGGQRQRIALARAIYSNRKWLVLDDPFAAVDLATEERIIERLRTQLADRAILLFSHRLAAFSEADRVLVLDAGRVVEQGTHHDLMRSGEIYPTIYQAQLRVEGGAS